MKRRLIVASVFALLLAGCGSSGKAQSTTGPGSVSGGRAQADGLLRVLEPDPRIRIGKLENGLTYYVIKHSKPENRAQLWLGVNAGSVLESDDQQGLAHFVEHMAFNGTKNFEKMAIVNYLESIGMKFGPDVNAYTSFDETVYMLQVPTDDAAIVDTGMNILREWASRVSFDPKEVDKERGVVTEEWRLGRGAGMRIADKQYPVLFQGSQYAKRLPIGKKEILQNAPVETLVRFYKDWYRPDLMAVVAVGDFDPDAIEAKIKKTFGDLPKSKAARDRAKAPMPSHDETLVSIETDPEMPQTSVSVHNKMPHREERTLGNYRRLLAESLYHNMLGARLSEIRERPEAPFLFAYSSTQALVRGTDSFVRYASVKEGHVEDALSSLFEEVLRVERHGFTATEFARARKEILRGYERRAKEADKTNGRQLAAEMLRHYFEDEFIPGSAAELEITRRLVPTITLDELNGLAKAWSGSKNRVILVSGPAKAKMPTKDSVLAILAAVEKKSITPYRDEVSDLPLMAKKPAAGTVTDEKTIKEIGVTQWTLSNGVRIVVKPTQFKNDEIRISAFSPGGTSLASDRDYGHARSASGIVNGAGVGQFDRIQLRKLLAGKVVRISAHIGELEEGISGTSSPQDLETAMQLVHLRFTAPRKDKKAFQAWKVRQIEFVRNRRLRPESAFFEDVTSFINRNHLRRRPTTVERIEKVDLDKAFAFYKDRFADASDFTFTIVGNVELDKLKPLVETYLASLPSKGRKEKWRDVNVRVLGGIKKKIVRRGSEPKSMVWITFHGPQKWTEEGENDMDMLRDTLRIRLREILREDMGGVYGVQSFGRISRRPKQRRSYGVFFGCSPDNVDTLLAAVRTEIKAIQKAGIGQEYVDKIKKLRVRQREVEIKRNRFWLGALEKAYRYNEDPREILEHQKWVDAVSSQRIQAAAKRFARANQVFTAILYPEKVAKSAK